MYNMSFMKDFDRHILDNMPGHAEFVEQPLRISIMQIDDNYFFLRRIKLFYFLVCSWKRSAGMGVTVRSLVDS